MPVVCVERYWYEPVDVSSGALSQRWLSISEALRTDV